MKANITEIFKSRQGEGPYTGVEQVFVRFAGCNLGCRYCDTGPLPIQRLDVDEVIARIHGHGECHSVSLTGGEPLLHADFIRALAWYLQQDGKRVYLETNGVLPQALEKVIEYVDIIAMDFKLPSATGSRPHWHSHREFLRVARHKEVFIKAVVSPHTQIYDIMQSLKVIIRLGIDAPFILQPQFSHEEELTGKLRFFQTFCYAHGVKALIMPQMHKKWGIR